VAREGSVEQLVEAVKGAVAGRLECPPHIASSLFRRLRELSAPLGLSSGATRLTRREREIVGLIGREFSNKEIAWELHLSPATVKNHVHNIMEKLSVHRRSDIGLHLRTPIPAAAAPMR
jgi:two-component system nitrate/nitrite response regulator NarL